MRSINDQIADAQQTLMQDISGEFVNFAIKLKEELNREREQFVVKYEEDEVAALEEYGVTEITLGGVIEMLVDTENKDAVDEMVTQFQEKIDQEASAKDAAMTRGWQTEWKNTMQDVTERQHMRGRNIISEIIETTNAFKDSITKKFAQMREEDEMD